MSNTKEENDMIDKTTSAHQFLQPPVDSTKLCQLSNDVVMPSAYEDDVQVYWDLIDLYKTMRDKNQQKNKNAKTFKFMDGPPFVSGTLHYGHLAVGSYKSAVCNIMSMLGHDSSYILGYDCHGLPIESKVCSVHNLTSEDVERMGVANFNKLCDTMITDVKDSWTPLFKKFGRLADFENVYMTRDVNFMESCMWVFKQLYDKGLVYTGNKVMPYSHALETPLSNFEAGQNYQDVSTKSIYVEFKIIDVLDLSDLCIDRSFLVNSTISFVAWTTTPWTLPSNLALCVNADVEYILVKVKEATQKTSSSDDILNKYLILSKNSIANLFGKKQLNNISILHTFKGAELDKVRYEPVFDYMTHLNEKLGRDNNKFFRIICDSYVRDDGIGTAIVHQAPAFGDDDFRVCAKYGIIDNVTVSDYCPIDEKCKYTNTVSDYESLFVLDADDKIRNDLMKRGKLIKTQEYTHSYPHCYRTDTPLIYRTVRSIFIKLEPLKDRMIELNTTVTWYPKEIGSNRFGKWLENAKDWAVSRFRYYGTPIMIWTNDDDIDDQICIGSINELIELTGVSEQTITKSLHPEFVNDLKIKRDGKTYSRIPDIFDCWFESGCVPFGQIHYPFDKIASAQLNESEYLSDFICEGLDQTRGWFYTLLVLSTAILDKAPYKNVICTGMVLDEHGQKLSKRLNNYEDPIKVIADIGADYVRTYFIKSPLMRAEPLNFSMTAITRLKNRFVPYINSFKFMIEHTLNYINKVNNNNVNNTVNRIEWGDSFIQLTQFDNVSHPMDKWLLNRMIEIGQEVGQHVADFRMGNAIDVLIESFDELTNWYLKLNRDRLKGVINITEQRDSLSTLYTVLLTYTQLLAPFTPFLSEYLFQHIKMINVMPSIFNAKSVLLTDYPSFIGDKVDRSALILMSNLQRICKMIRNIRTSSTKHTSQMVQFKSCTISHSNRAYLDTLRTNIQSISNELNVVEFHFEPLEDLICIKARFNNKELGRTFRKNVNLVRELFDNLDQELLYKIYSGQNDNAEKISLIVDSETVVFEYPSEYFELYAIPADTLKSESNNSLYTSIDSDLMVRVDPTYDEYINSAYQLRLMYAAIQNIRKIMKLRPWNLITIIIDERFVQAVPDLLIKLGELLNESTSTVEVATFDANKLANYNTGMMHANVESHLDKFEWNMQDGAIIDGYIRILNRDKCR